MRRFLASVCLPLLLGLGACGDDDAETGDRPTITAPDDETTTTASPDESTTTSGPAVEVTEVDVTATEYAYDGVPELAPGLVRVTLANEGAEEHQALVVRLNDGVTLEEWAAAATTDPVTALDLTTGYGGPNAVAPGASVTTTAALDAGDYLMFCTIPAPDGLPHAAKGMLLPFTVAGDDGPLVLPADDELAGEIITSDFAFELPDEFDGQGTYAVANDGEQQHEVGVYELDDGASAADVVDALVARTAPPWTAVAGIGTVAALRGVDAYVELDLAPGEYVLICFVPDVAAEGRPHFLNGMIQPITVS